MADDYEFRVGERCGVDGCRSRRYRTNEGGFDVCERGHQHGISASLAEDDEDDFQGANRGKRFRRQKADKPKNERSELRSTRLLYSCDEMLTSASTEG